jgi:hypothetical protein
MFKIKTLVPLFLFTFFYCTVFAQTNFVAGTIINLKNDTIRGEINYQEWAYNPKKIQFRSKNSQSVKTYTCNDIKGFAITPKNEKYQTAILDIDYDPVDVPKLNGYNSIQDVEVRPLWTRDTAFLSIAAQGRLNLFSLFQYSDGKPHYFIQKLSSNPTID